MPEKEWMIYQEKEAMNRMDWRKTGVKKPFDKKKAYKLHFDEAEGRLTWPGRPEHRVGTEYVKENFIFEKRKPWFRREYATDPIPEIESCMAAQDIMRGIKVRVLDAAFEVFTEDAENEPPEVISERVRAKIEALNVPGLIEAANATLIPGGPQGKVEFAFGGFNVVVERNEVVVVLEKDEAGRHFLAKGHGMPHCGGH